MVNFYAAIGIGNNPIVHPLCSIDEFRQKLSEVFFF